MKKFNLLFKFTSIMLTFCMFCLLTGCANDSVGDGLIKDAVLSESNYTVGDYMGDYTVTDVNGNIYSFSEILKEKKAIVLNFWFINCGPCQMEFPYLQTAYNAYSDDIVVLALNPVDGKEKDIQKYIKQNNLSIPMVNAENSWVTAFSLRGFPTTVVIDRYGCIAFMHMGAVTEDGVFEKIFAEFTSDNYKQSTYSSINDFK